MLNNLPIDFLSLHRNIQYYNTHNSNSYFDSQLNVHKILDNDDPCQDKISNLQLAKKILNKISQFYNGSERDDKWVELIKKDCKQLLKIIEMQNPDATSKIHLLFSKMFDKIESLQSSNNNDLEPVDWLNKGILNVLTIFEQDLSDAQGVHKFDLYSAIQSQDQIIIIPKSMFTKMDEERWSQLFFDRFINIFEQKNSGFLVLIPAILIQNDESSLVALDLDPNQLKFTCLNDVFTQASHEIGTIDHWEALWTSSPKLKKRWHFSGHGQSSSKTSSTHIVGLNEPHFKKLLNAVYKHNTEILSLSSCFVGRTIPEKQSVFFPKSDFPVLLWGRIDTPTKAIENDYTQFWIQINNFLDNSSSKKNTKSAFSRFLFQSFQGLPELPAYIRAYQNQPLLMLPHTPNSPLGFKSVQGHSNVHTLTYADVRVSQLETRKPFSMQKREAELYLSTKNKQLSHTAKRTSDSTNKPIIEIYPLLIPVTLRIEEDDVEFHSMISGNAHHHVHKIILEKGEGRKLFETVLKVNLDDNGSSKAFYISSLESPTEKLCNISLIFTPDNGNLIYYDFSTRKYYHYSQELEANFQLRFISKLFEKDQIDWSEISEFQALTFFIKGYIKTLPSPTSTIHSTGGQEEPKQVPEAILEGFTWSAAIKPHVEILFYCLSKIAFEEADPCYLPEFQLLPEGYQELCIQSAILRKNDENFALSLCNRGVINKKNWKGVSECLKGKKLDFFKALIEKKLLDEKDILELIPINHVDLIPILISWVNCQREISNSICIWIFNSFKSSRDISFFKVFATHPSFISAVDPVEVAKELNYEVAKELNFKEKEGTFDIMMAFIEKAISHNDYSENLFKSLLPWALYTSPHSFATWALEYNSKHKILDEQDCFNIIKQEAFNVIENSPGGYSGIPKEYKESLIQYFDLIKKNSGFFSEDVPTIIKAIQELGKSCSESDCQILLPLSIVDKHPEILDKIIKIAENRNLLNWLNYIEKTFTLSQELLDQLKSFKLALYVINSNSNDIFEMNSWLNSLPESQKQNSLRKAFINLLKWNFKIDVEDMYQVLISLGLNIDELEFIDAVKDELTPDKFYNSSPNYQFLVTHFKFILDQLSAKHWRQCLSKIMTPDRIHESNLYPLMLYLRNRNVNLQGVYEIVLRWLEELTTGFSLKLKYSIEADSLIASCEYLAEWLALNEEGPLGKDKNNEELAVKLLPRLIIDNCEERLIMDLLTLTDPSEHKDIYERVFIAACKKGAVYVINHLKKIEIKYSPEVFQKGKLFIQEKNLEVNILDSLLLKD